MARSPWPRRFMAMGLGFFLLALIEVGIRLSGVAAGSRYAPKKLIEIYEKGELKGTILSAQGPVFYTRSDGLIETKKEYHQGDGQGFPHSGSMRRNVFAKHPKEGVARYFLLGGSAALGQQPVNLQIQSNWKTIQLGNQVAALSPEMAISGKIEKKWGQKGKQIEVINLGMIAQDSAGVRRLAQEALQYNPKGLLLYLGNNEGIGMAAEMSGTELPIVPEVRSLLRKSHAYRLIADWLKPKKNKHGPSELSGTAPDVLGRLVQTQWRAAGKALIDEGNPKDSVHEAINKRLQVNLEAIVDMAQRQGVSVTVIPAPPHIGYPPFYSANDPDLPESGIFSYSNNLKMAQDHYNNQAWRQLSDLLATSLKIESKHAKGWHMYGEALHQQGKREQSKKALEMALALDLSKKRSALSFGKVVDAVCQRERCTAINAYEALSQQWNSKGLDLYKQLWGDHEHLTPAGCDFMAELFVQNMP